jgi:hypothetical protein
MNEPKREYVSYLLRLWQVAGKGTTGWRASLESPRTGQSQGFASLEDLFQFLRRRTGGPSDANDAD